MRSVRVAAAQPARDDRIPATQSGRRQRGLSADRSNDDDDRSGSAAVALTAAYVLWLACLTAHLVVQIDQACGSRPGAIAFHDVARRASGRTPLGDPASRGSPPRATWDPGAAPGPGASGDGPSTSVRRPSRPPTGRPPRALDGDDPHRLKRLGWTNGCPLQRQPPRPVHRRSKATRRRRELPGRTRQPASSVLVEAADEAEVSRVEPHGRRRASRGTAMPLISRRPPTELVRPAISR